MTFKSLADALESANDEDWIVGGCGKDWEVIKPDDDRAVELDRKHGRHKVTLQ